MAAAASEVEYTYSAHTVPKPQGFSTTPRSLVEFVRQHTGDVVYRNDAAVIVYRSASARGHVVHVDLQVTKAGAAADGITFTISFHDADVNVSARSANTSVKFRRQYQLSPLFHPATLVRRIMGDAVDAGDFFLHVTQALAV